MLSLTPLQCFLLGVAASALGVAAVWLLLRPRLAEWRRQAPDFLTRLHIDEICGDEPKVIPESGGLAPRLLEWLLGTRSLAVYRGTYHARSLPDLCSRLEESTRANYPGDQGFVIHATRSPFCMIWAYCGTTAGFSIQLIPQPSSPGEANGLLLVSRWSRLHTASVHAVAGCFFLTLFGGIVLLATAGWQFPGAASLVLGVSTVVAVLAVKLLREILMRIEASSSRRLPDDEIARLVEQVRALAESDLATAAAQ
jgi:hypothetical protein